VIATAVVFAAWRSFHALPMRDRHEVIGLGVALALMNASFYLAIARLPLATAGAIEFLGPIALAAIGICTG
jgi:inner membrane transporter RhtA